MILPSLDTQVYLAVCGKFHAFSLAREYALRGHLAGLYAADQHFAPPAGVPSSRFHNRWDFKLWRIAGRYAPAVTGHSTKREYAAFDRWIDRCFDKLPGGVFHGWNTHVSQTLKHLDPSLWLRCVERSCPHNLFQHRLLQEESARLDLPYSADADALEAAVQELYDADVIVAPSQYSAGSYDDPVLRAKIRVNPLGANYSYREREATAPRPLRLLLVGNAFLRKGTHDLIEAFRLIDDPAAELWIRGEVPPEYRRRIVDPRIKVFSAVTYERLQRLYREATMFCLPSVDEGFGMVALEALSYGLPVIYTDHCGVADVLTPAVGMRVPIRSAQAIAAAVRVIAGWRPEDFERFDQERAAVLAATTWRNCADRMMRDVYRRPQAS